MSDAPPMGILTAEAFDTPRILLAGAVDYAMYERFRDQLADAPKTGLIVVELSTLGGDPEVARMMGEDIRFQSDANRRAAWSFWARRRSIRPARPS